MSQGRGNCLKAGQFYLCAGLFGNIVVADIPLWAQSFSAWFFPKPGLEEMFPAAARCMQCVKAWAVQAGQERAALRCFPSACTSPLVRPSVLLGLVLVVENLLLRVNSGSTKRGRVGQSGQRLRPRKGIGQGRDCSSDHAGKSAWQSCTLSLWILHPLGEINWVKSVERPQSQVLRN